MSDAQSDHERAELEGMGLQMLTPRERDTGTEVTRVRIVSRWGSGGPVVSAAAVVWLRSPDGRGFARFYIVSKHQSGEPRVIRVRTEELAPMLAGIALAVREIFEGNADRGRLARSSTD